MIFTKKIIGFSLLLFLCGCNCVEEGRMIMKKPISPNEKKLQCCKGLKEINSKMENIAYCTYCGDNICIMPEEYYNCPEDCQPSAVELAKEKKKKEEEEKLIAEKDKILCKDECGNKTCQKDVCDIKSENCVCPESEVSCEEDCLLLTDVMEFKNISRNPEWINKLLISMEYKSLIEKKSEEGFFLRATLYETAKTIKIFNNNNEQIGEVKLMSNEQFDEKEFIEFLNMHK